MVGQVRRGEYIGVCGERRVGRGRGRLSVFRKRLVWIGEEQGEGWEGKVMGEGLDGRKG